MSNYRDYMNRKKKERESSNTLSSSSSNYRNYMNSQKYGFNTLAEDEASVREKLNSAYNGWQSAEDMASYKESISDMYSRLRAYQDSGNNSEDLNNLITAYSSALGNWDDMSNIYAQYKNADAYNIKKKESDWVKANSGLSYADVQNRLKTASGDEADYLNRYGIIAGYNNLEDYDKDLANREKPNLITNFADNMATGGVGRLLGKKKEKEKEDTTYEELSTARNLYASDHAFDEFKSLQGKNDFAKLSSTEFKPSEAYDVADGSGESRSVFSDIYNKMTDEEKAMADYIGNTEGMEGYTSYMNKMRNTVERRSYEETQSGINEFVDKHPFVGGTGLTAASYVSNIISEPFTLAEELGGIIGLPYSPYGGMAELNTLTQGTREHISQNINDIGGIGGKVGSFMYNVGNSTIDSVVGAKVLGAIGLAFTGTQKGAEAFSKSLSVFMGSGAFNSAYKDGIERGLSEDQAMAIGLANGINEVLFEALSIERLVKAKEIDSFRKGVIEVLKQAGTEGSEEVFTDLANMYAEQMILGGQSEISEQKRALMAYGYTEEEAEKVILKEKSLQTLESFLAGAASGGLSSAGYNAWNGTNYSSNRKAGATIRQNQRIDDLANLSDKMQTDDNDNVFSGAKEYRDRLSAKYEGDLTKATDGELGVLYKKSLVDAQTSYVKQNRADIKDYVTGMLLAQGETEENASAMADSVTKDLLGEKLDSDDKNILTIDAVKEVEDAVKENGIGEESKLLTESIEDIKGLRDMNFRKEGTIKDAEVLDKGKVKITNADGTVETVKTSKLDARTRELIGVADDYSGKVREMFLSNYNGQNTSLYTSAFDLIEKSAEAGTQLDDGTIETLSKIIPIEQIKDIYKEATIIGAKDMEARREAFDKARKSFEKQFTKGTFNTSIVRESLNNREKALYDIAEAFSELGMNITLIKDPSKNKDGMFSARENTVYINLAARYYKGGQINTGYVVTAMSHEFTHWMEHQDRINGHEKDGMYHMIETLVRRDLGEERWEKFIKDEQDKYRKNHKDEVGFKEMSYENASSEVVARACENMLNDTEAMARVLKDADDTEVGRFRGAIKEFFDSIHAILQRILGTTESGSEIAQIIEDMDGEMERLRNVWIKGFEQALEYNQHFESTLDKAGLMTDGNYVYADDMNSQQTFAESDYATNTDAVAKEIADKLGVDEEVAKQYIKDVGGVAKYIRQHSALLDYTSVEGKSAWVSNPEYGGSLDYSFLCPKRLTYTGTMNAIRDALDRKKKDIAFSVTDFLFLRSSLKANGYESPCSFCFVESARMRFDKYNKKFINNAIKEGLEYIPKFSELNNPDKLEKMRYEHKETYDAYISYMNTLSQRKPKMLEERRAYDGDILKAFTDKSATKDGKTVEYKNLRGGIRFNSFSDFEVVHMIDSMQAILDMSRVGLAGFGYTKQKGFAEVFGNTGLKINLSCVAKGVSADGMHIVFDDYEGMNSKDAIALRNKFSKNVGVCCVVFTDEQLKAALCDERIDYVLPFHRSQWSSADYAKLGLPEKTKDFTKAQTEKGEDGKRLKEGNTPFLSYWDFNKSGKENVQNYLDKVINNDTENAVKPLFADVLTQNADGTWSMYTAKDSSKEERIKEKASDNYWKLLTEFKLYDNEGNPSPQNPVRPTFEMKAANNLLKTYDGSHTAFPVADNVVDEFLKYKEDGIIPQGDEFDGFRNTKKDKVTVMYVKEGETQIDKKTGKLKLSPKQFKAENVGDAIDIALEKGLDVDIDATYERQEYDDLNSEQEEYASIFTSKMSRVIDGIKSDKIGSASVVSYLKGRGVKDEEIKWSGIETFLEGKKSVTKADLQEFAKGSMLQIEEKEFSSSKSNGRYIDTEDPSFSYSREEAENLSKEYAQAYGFTYEVTEEEHGLRVQYYDNGELVESFFMESEFGDTKWHEYVTDGTTNYREILFKMPGSTYSNSSMQTHWGEKGVLAHARIGDRTLPNGQRMLFVEEIQSDWHNASQKNPTKENTHITKTVAASGKPLYYLTTNKNLDEVTRITSREIEEQGLGEDINAIHDYAISKVATPDAPFSNGKYIEFVMKRLLRMAAEGGYDSIGWTTAKMQEERWSDEYAEGYRIEYDQDIPKFMNKYGKQWGVRTEDVAIEEPRSRVTSITKDRMDIIVRILTNQYGINKSDATNYVIKHEEVDPSVGLKIQEALLDSGKTRSVSEYWDMMNPSAPMVHSVTITDAMKNSVLYEGQDLYSEQAEASKEEMREWFATTKPEERKESGGFFYFGNISKPFVEIGLEEKRIRFGKAKIQSILEKHEDHMTEDDIISVIDTLNDPMVIMSSLTETKTSIVVLGEKNIGGNRIVLTSVKVNEDNLEIDSYTVTGRYGKEKEEIQYLLDNSVIYYMNEDKKKTISWANALGLQLPSATLGSGLIKKLPQSMRSVKSYNVTNDSKNNKLNVKQMEFFKDSKALTKKGRLLNLYHGTFAEFTQFDMSKADENAYYGPGIYLTTDLSEAQTTYATEKGGDVQDRIDLDAGILLDEWGYAYNDIPSEYNHKLYTIDESGAWHKVDDSRADELYAKAVNEASKNYKNGKVMELYANIKNPYIVDRFSNENPYDVRVKAVEQGCDGIIDYSVPTRFGSPQGTVHVVAFAENQVKSVNNPNPTDHPDTLMSEQEDETYNDYRKASNEVNKQYSKLTNDVRRLEAMLKLDKTKTLDPAQLRRTAQELIEETESDLSVNEVISALKETYDYILQLPNHRDDARFERTIEMAKKAAKKILTEQSNKNIDAFSKEVLQHIRKSRVKFDDAQKAEAINQYGGNYRNAFMGKIVIVKDGIELDSWWQDMAENYPGLFKSDVNSADMPTELINIIDKLKSVKVDGEVREVSDDDIQYVAERIYAKFWDGFVSRSDLYDARLKQIMDEHEAQIDAIKKSQSQYLESKINYYREQQMMSNKDYIANKVAEEKARMQDAALRKATIDKITKNAVDLANWIKSPNTKSGNYNRVPEALRGPVSEVIKAIDFSSKQMLGMTSRTLHAGTPTQKDISIAQALSHLYDVMADANTDKVDLNTYLDLPPMFISELKALVTQVNDIQRKIGKDNAYVLNQMTSEQLQNLLNTVKTVRKAVTDFNKLLANANGHSVDSVAYKTIEYAKRLGQRKWSDGLFKDFFAYDQALPYYAFKRFGEGGQEMFTELQDGWDKFAYNARDIKNFVEKTYKPKEVRDWNNEVHTFTILEPKEDGTGSQQRELKLTTAQIMSLYCLSKREQAKGHLLGGGIVPTDITTHDGKFNTTQKITQPNAVRITDESLNKILETLTDRQIEVADALQKFMAKECADWGNEITMKRFGILGFTEENYFPIKSDSNIIGGGMRENEKSIYALLNMSFTKALTQGANNQIMIDDIFQVFTVHASDMAKYNALALPVLDMIKWWNYKEKDRNGRVDNSTRVSLESAFGKASNKYINNFLSDLNGNMESHRGDKLQRKMLSRYKRAAVAANLQVAFLQPLSYIRAYNAMDGRYLNKALRNVFEIKQGMEESKEHSGLTIWKDFGFFNTDISRGLDSLFRQDGTWVEKAVDKSMEPAGFMDSVTWGIIWNACKYEVEATTKLEKGSDDYYKAINDKMRDVIYRTQVIDSTMTRSDVMRSTGTLEQLDSAFLSEPTISYNVMMDSISDLVMDTKLVGKGEAFKRHGRKIAKAIELYALSAAVESALRLVFSHYRGNADDDEEVWRDYATRVLEELNPLSKIPYVKSIVEIVENTINRRNTVRMDQQFIVSNVQAIQAIQKSLDNGITYKTVYRTLVALSQDFGIPLGSTLTEIVSLWNLIFGNMFPDLKITK